MAECYEIADALIAAIKATSPIGSVVLQVSRRYVAKTNLPEIEASGNSACVIFVLMMADDIELISRDETGQETFKFDVCVLKKFESGIDPKTTAANASIDPYLKLARALALLFVPGNTMTAGGDTIQWRETKWPALWDVKRLDEDRVFQSIITYYFIKE